MSIVVIGVNHRTGPLSVLERLTIAPDDVAKAVVGLAARDNLREVAVLSTCNRTEVYAVAERFHGAYADIRDFLCELGGLRADELHPYLYSQHDDAAARHLFEVAPGLDSAVLGESEILGQVRTRLADRPGRGRRRRRSTCCSATRCASASGRARRPPSAAARRRSATPRSRWSPTASARSPAATCSSSGPARWASASPRCTTPVPAITVVQPHPNGAPTSPSASAARRSASTASASIAAADVVVACTASGESAVVTRATRRNAAPTRHVRC